MVFAGVLTACGGAQAPAPSVAARQPAPSTCPELPDELIAAEVQSAAPTAELPPGDYWIRRVGGGRGHRNVRPGSPPTTESSVSTRCVPFTVGAGAERRTWQLPSVRLSATRREDAWRLSNPRLTIPERSFEIADQCEVIFRVEAHAGPGPIRSSAGLVFANAAACRATPNRFDETCRGEECSSSDERARPFDLGSCDVAVGQLGTRAQPFLTPPHAVIARATRRFERVVRAGGRLWERATHMHGCVAVTVRPVGDDITSLRSGYTFGEDGVFESSETFRIETHFHRAIEIRRSTSWTAAHGAGGLGSQAGSRHGLHVGDGVVLLGTRTLFLARAGCHASLPERAE